jgi:uncharacterized membrane protein YkoI
MNRRLIFPAVAMAAFSVTSGLAVAKSTTVTSESSPAFAGHQFAGTARVSLARARTIALAARPGAITDQELEKEAGGSGLRYSFDIRNAGATYEVGVDARTAKVLQNTREGLHPD